jgi:DNA invertase Pin-like site-specific DNA recombinase
MKLGYARVSTANGQESGLETQIDALTKAGCEKVYSDKLSGKNRQRPELEAMLKALRKGDNVVAVKIDRIARSMGDLYAIAKSIEDAGCDMAFLDQDIDTSTPTGKLLFNILGSLAEFERTLIVSRVKAGQARAKAKGTKLGRKRGTTKQQDAQMLLAYEQGQSWNQIADTFGVSRMSVYRRLRNKIAYEKLEQTESEITCKNNQ